MGRFLACSRYALGNAWANFGLQKTLQLRVDADGAPVFPPTPRVFHLVANYVEQKSQFLWAELTQLDVVGFEHSFGSKH